MKGGAVGGGGEGSNQALKQMEGPLVQPEYVRAIRKVYQDLLNRNM